MKTVDLIQGTPEWHAHRRQHWNASDAPAMLGVSPYKSRMDLLREYATGISPEVDPVTQKRFDDGHQFEALARTEAERIVCEELFPCIGVSGRYSASFDGLTVLGDTAWEHKTLNARLIRAFTAIKLAGYTKSAVHEHLPEDHRAQMEHQLLVSGAERVLFTASQWDDDGDLVDHRACWYESDPEMRERIQQGWAQFERDLEAFQPEHEAPKPIGKTPESLPYLHIEARGMVTASNLGEFKEHALAVLGAINRELTTDEDFADAEATVKWCKGVEDRLESAKAGVLGQMADVDAVCRTIDDIAAETRRVRLELDKLVKSEKERRKEALVRDGVESVRAHYAEINAGLQEFAIGIPASLASEIGASIKGLKTLASMRAAIDSAVAAAKVSASSIAGRVAQNGLLLREVVDRHLFADAVTLAHTKSPDDLRNLIAARIADAKRREEERLETERQRIRAEEEARARKAAEDEERARKEAERREAERCQPQLPPKTHHVPDAGKMVGRRLKLGEINAAISPLSVSADGLAQLGIHPVAQDKAAKLYAADDFERIRQALIGVLERADIAKVAA
jgi:putative phage-type endonuclease